MKRRILLCFGTRPEWIKIKPLVLEFDRNTFDVYFTGQHTTLVDFGEIKRLCLEKGAQLFKQYDKPATKLLGNRLDTIITNCMGGLDDIQVNEYAGVLVQGDTASAFACALSAFNRQVPVIHLEAGLRTGDLDRPYPEEGYRQMISRITHIHLAPTDLGKKNLENENVVGTIAVVGNTVLDSVRKLVDSEDITTTLDRRVLITLHRRENHEVISNWFDQLESLATEYNDIEFVFPIHPNPDVTKFADRLKRVKVIDPLPHDDLVRVMASSMLIITDSGGIQEEATYLNKKTIVCRDSTERPEGIWTRHLYLCKTPGDLKEVFGELIKNPYILGSYCPYGDGYSAKKIRVFLKSHLSWG